MSAAPRQHLVDTAKSKAELLREVQSLRARVAALEASLQAAEALQGYAGAEPGVLEQGIPVGTSQANRDYEALHDDGDIVSEVLDTLGAMLVVIDAQGRVVRFNRAAEEMTRLTTSKVRGRYFWEFFPYTGAERVRDLVQPLLLGELPSRYEEIWVGPPHDRHCFRWTARVLRDVDGRVKYVIVTGLDDTERKLVENSLQESERRLRNQNNALVALAQHKAVGRGELDDALRVIAEAAARTLEVERVSIWLYDERKTSIRCVELFELSKGEHSRGRQLWAEHYPAYFSAIETERTIAADDARHDARTCEFAEHYLQPLQITSLMDCPIRSGGQMQGIVCHEHVGPARRWTAEEQHFAGSIADFVSLALEASERRRVEAELRRAHVELESRVEERTAELSRTNQDLQREIAVRRQAESEVRKQSAILSSVLDSISDGVVVTDGEGRFVIFNPAAERILRVGRTDTRPEEWPERYGLYLPDRTTPVPTDQLPLVRAMNGEAVDECELFVRHEGLPEGMWLSVNARPLQDERGAVAVVRDITERRQAHARILAEQHRTRQMLAAHERDRQLIAYEIHDGMVQDVTGALMHLEAFRQRSALEGERLSEEFDLSLQLLRDTIGEARHLISGLRPPILDELGLIAALDYLIGEHRTRSNLKIQFVHDVQFEKLEPLLESTVFRIAQEALNNVQRHSRADRAKVVLRQKGNRLRLSIRDWGVGFNPQRRLDHRFGIYGIRERARLLGGRARIESVLGQGTRILVDLPISYARHTAGQRSHE